MPKVTLAQFSFTRGELAPALHGRSDWKYYFSGAEKLLNLITRPQGGAVKRGGLRLVAPALDDGNPSHLVPFRFSVRQSYILEFADYRMRVIKDGGVVVYPRDHELAGREVTIDTPYPASSLSRLRHAQTADVMILTHPDHPPRRLSRRDHHDWRLERLLTGERTPTPEGLRILSSGGDGSRYVVTALSGQGGESPPSEAVTADNTERIDAPGADTAFSELYAWLRLRDYSYMPEDLRFHERTMLDLMNWLIGLGYRDVDRVYDAGGYRWLHVKPGQTATTSVWWPANDLSPLVSECLHACGQGWAGTVKASLFSAVEQYVADYNAGLSGSRVTDLAWNAAEGASVYRIYRDRGGSGESAYSLLGETAATTFTDANLAAGTAGLPEEGELFTAVDDYPGVCAFFEQRLILGRSNNKPTTFWGSETGCYNSFVRHSPVEDSDSYEFTLSSGEMNEIHWIVPLNDMLLGSSGGEWKAGGGGGAITPSNINARVQSWYGCAALPPVVVGRTVIFAGRGRRTIRNFSYSLEADGYSGQDLTTYASHLFSRRSIVAMCHQQDPSGIVWVVMSDGALLSCTYAPEEDVVAWSRHETRGRFEHCGSLVDIDGSDQIYFCVAREINGATRRFIETLEEPADHAGDETEGFFLDCGLTYSGPPANRVSGLDHLEGEAVSVLADGNVFTDVRVRDGAIELPGGFTASVVHVGLPYTAELITLELEPEAGETIRNRARFVVAATVRLANSRECLYSHSGGLPSEMKFRTGEMPGRPIRLFTGEKNIVFSTPPGLRAAKLRFVSETPTPFILLGIVAEASCGQPA